MKEAPQMSSTIPHLFMCPISLDLFKDPVTLCTGQTYDRSNIEKWIAAGNLTCPVTMQRLHDVTMVPNHTLRHLIDRWLQLDPKMDPYYLTKVDSLASLKRELRSCQVCMSAKVRILEKVRDLSTESAQTNSCLIRLGFLSLLLELVFGDDVESELARESSVFVEKSLCCVLGMLSFGGYESLNVLKEESKMERLRNLFEQGTSLIRESLCNLVEIVSLSVETRELCNMLGRNGKLLCGLVALVRQSGEEAEAGVKAVSALCSLDSNRENLVEEGVVSGLLAYISNTERHEGSSAAKALATIEMLLELKSGKQAAMNSPDGVKILVKMVFRVSDHEGSESAVRSLMILCSDSLRTCREAISAGVLTQLLLLLQSQCSSSTKTKARMLLKMLRSKREEDQPKHS